MRIYARKNNAGEIVSYYLEISRTDRPSLKTKDYQTALRKAAEILEEREKQGRGDIVHLQKSITIAQFKAAYIHHLGNNNYSDSHIRNHNNALTYLIDAIGGNTPLRNIGSYHFEEYKKHRIELGHKHSYINTDIKKVRSAFAWGVYENYLTKNPFVGGKPIRTRGKAEEDDDVKFMLPTHVDRLRETISLTKVRFKKTSATLWQDMIECFLYTGARRHEIVKLHRKDIDFIKGIITLRDNKNDKTHRITIHDKLRPVLVRLCDKKQGRIFDVTQNYVSNRMTKFFKDAGLSDFYGTHIFRYTVISLLICEGCTAEQVALTIGHATPETTMKIYAKIHTNYKREILKKLPY